MSGGVAYVLDADGTFSGRVNHEMVELQDVGDDAGWLVEVIGRHRDETDSVVAGALLGDWPRSRERFVKVMPRDYQRVLDAAAGAEAEGRSVEDAIMAASRG